MINIQTFDKQYQALQYLLDNKTNTICYGGSVYSGKSYLACLYAIYMSISYPGTRGAICRARLTNLVKSTYSTFVDMCSQFGLGDFYKYNSQTHIITFNNGSQIFLLDLAYLPQDPKYTRFSGMEFTWVIIDEAAECPLDAMLVLRSRIRYKLSENGLISKMLICTNPCKGWLYDMFYLPWKEKRESQEHRFVQALPKDNIYADQNVLKTYSIETLGRVYYNLLVLGDWNFDANDLDLFDFDDLNECFYRNSPGDKYYLTCDVAGQGEDKTVITIWKGFQCISIQVYPKTTVPQVVDYIKRGMLDYGIRIMNVVVDAGGVGQGVADYLPGCQKYIANSRPLRDEKGYSTMKDQLFFKFAQMVKDNKIGISCDANMQTELVNEFQAHKIYNIDGGVGKVTPKNLVRMALGRSPDVCEALVYRALFEYKQAPGKLLIGGF